MKYETITLNEERNVTLTSFILPVGGEFRNISKRPAILILPGGGYGMCSEREAEPVAMAYLAAGYDAFILRYSVNQHRQWPNPLDDYEQAMSYIREHAKEWHILPDKVVTTNAPASVHVTVIEVGGKGSGKYMVSLVNATGTTYRPIHEIVPVHNICVELHEGTYTDSRILFGEEGAAIAPSEGGTLITIPVLEEFASFLVETKK